MTDTQHPAPKKPARPNLFAPQEATRVVDERISVLASLDTNRPPKKKQKRGLAKSTVVMLTIAITLFAGLIYLAVTQQAVEQPMASEAPHQPPVANYVPPSAEVASATQATTRAEEAPSVSLSTLAGSSPVAESSAPASAVIENAPSPAPRDPIAILQGSSTPEKAAPAKVDSKPAPASGRGTQESLLKALTAPDKTAPPKPATPNGSTTASNDTQKSRRISSADKPSAQTPARNARPSATKTSPVDSDVVLLEGLLVSSNREEAKRRAAAKQKPKEAADAASVEKVAP